MDCFYIPLHDAPRLLEERRPLRQRVERWWSEMGWHIPEPCYSLSGALVFGKPIATGRYEDALFVHYANELELQPVWMEHNQGSLSTESPIKRSLVHPTFFEKRGRNGGLVVRKRKLACMQANRMRPISEIILPNGERLVDYHHRLHRKVFQQGDEARIDVSDFYNQFGKASNYYVPYLSLFLAHAVLVEDYHGGEDAEVVGELTSNVFVPAFRRLSHHFGVNPLIARMPWHEHLQYYVPEHNDHWMKHRVVPEEMLSHLS